MFRGGGDLVRTIGWYASYAPRVCRNKATVLILSVLTLYTRIAQVVSPRCFDRDLRSEAGSRSRGESESARGREGDVCR